jgi:hypothetical protein
MTIIRVAVFSFIAMLSLTSASCSKDGGKGEQGAQQTSKSEGHAPAGAKPGSHEDWCGEHQVPESQCTRCNPSLTAAFKATGDWCAEHGLPESQCLKCNPNVKIVRPPKEK